MDCNKPERKNTKRNIPDCNYPERKIPELNNP